MLKELAEEQAAIKLLEARGYSVLPQGRTNLSWNRTLPLPEKLDFQQEALVKIREQLTIHHIHFTEREMTTHATLRLL